MSLKKQGKYRFNDFEVDLALRLLQRDGYTISISPKTFDLLAFFVLHPQQLVATETLMHAMWPNAFAEESNLSQHIFLLRKALSSSQPGTKVVVTVPGRGYRFNASVKEIPPPKPQPEPVFPSPDPEHEPLPSFTGTQEKVESESDSDDANSRPGRPAFFTQMGPLQVAAAFGLVAVLAIGSWLLWRWFHTEDQDANQRSLGLLIADFDNSTSDPNFDLSIRTALAIDLGQSPYLRVTPDQKVSQALEAARAAAEKTPATLQSALALTRTVCLNLKDQAYLTGDLRRLGQNYLLTLRAYDCGKGATLAESRGVAETPDKVVSILDRVALDLRQQLGESKKSTRRFNKPLFADRAPSLAALKVYADAGRFIAAARYSDAIPLLHHAIDLDPKFALAHADLGAAHANLGQKEMASASLTRAYELRDSVDEESRFFIVATFNNLVTGDLQASIRNDKAWSEAYPRNPAPSGNLAVLLTEIGQATQALDAGRRALELDPTNPNSYEVLARAQMYLGQYEEAASTCRLAITRQLDSQEIHGFLLQIAYLRLDQQAMDEQIDWASKSATEMTAPSYMLEQQGRMAFAEGKVKAAQAFFTKAIDGYRKQNLTETADRLLASEARIEADLGLTETPRGLLNRLPESLTSVDIPATWAAIGETTRAESLLQAQLDANPTATLWQQQWAPQVRASIALNQHKPGDALQDLQVALPYDLSGFALPYLRGRAYLADKQPAQAEAEFHKILEHPGIEPLSHAFPLARLGLARALVQQDKLVDATFAYKIVLQIWSEADPDLPSLKAAKAEYAKLSGAPPKKPAIASKAPPLKTSAAKRK